MAWTNFEHQIWKTLKKYDLDQQNDFILAVSGGVDSMALLEVMLSVKPQARFTVAYYHHGPSDDVEQANYRNRCAELIVKTLIKFPEAQIHFKTEKSLVQLTSEASFREARWKFIKNLRTEAQPILTAHHLDDWVETLTLKLIRGVGPEGFTGFRQWDGTIFRPFLECHKADLQSYTTERKVEFIEDPSNQSDHYLRNWLRNEWFRMLDEKNPSGYQNYSRSLLRLQQSLETNQSFQLQFFNDDSTAGLDRSWYFGLSEPDQIRALSLFLRHHSIFNFTGGQLEEVKKRLDKNQKDLTFTVISVKWVINATQIMLAF